MGDSNLLVVVNSVGCDENVDHLWAHFGLKLLDEPRFLVAQKLNGPVRCVYFCARQSESGKVRKQGG